MYVHLTTPNSISFYINHRKLFHFFGDAKKILRRWLIDLPRGDEPHGQDHEHPRLWPIFWA